MNVPSCIEANTKDKTMLIRFGGRAQKSVWVNGLELREYDFDMEDFLTGEHGVGEVTAHELSQCWEVTELDEDENELYFTEAEKADMIKTAKKTTEMYVKTGVINKGEYHSKKLDRRLACFVTIKDGDELRGCIGTIEPVDTLYNSIIENSISAATRDPRFKPIKEKELVNLNYEVSVLSVPELIQPESVDSLFSAIKGKGVIINKDMRRGVYLPQVWEHFKSEGDFLSSLCQKAGLFKEEWKDYKAMKFSVFELVN